MRIRKMLMGDAEGMAEIERLSFPIPWTADSFRTEYEHNRHALYIVAEENDFIAGFAGAWVIFDEAHVTNIAVHPDMRGKGIGEKLLLVLMQASIRLGAEKMFLEVRPSNEAAVYLYKKNGFAKISVRKHYYSDNGEDAIVMRAELNDWVGGAADACTGN